MANVHMKLSWRTSNAGNNPTTSVVVVYNTVKNILIVVGIYAVAVLVIKMSWLTVGEVIIGMSARKAQR